MWFLALGLALGLARTGAVPLIQSRIVGGWECNHSQPWQAALYHYNHFECGGVLVDPQWVLTAAHCISDNYQLWLGRHNLFEEEEDAAQYAQVSGSFPHPGFNLDLLKNHTTHPGEDYSYDLMLLRLAEPVQLSDRVRPLGLPTRAPEPGATCRASGWGSTNPYPFEYPDELQCVDLKILPNKVCAEAHPQKVTDVMLCAGNLEGGKDTCTGDSGGPLVCDGVLQGITSWGHTPCARPNMPGVFTRVLPLVDWIKKTMADNA